MTLKDIAFIVDEALSHARGCIFESQATEAGYLFGADLLRDEFDPKRQTDIQTGLIGALSETNPGSFALAFMNASLAAVTAAWGDLL